MKTDEEIRRMQDDAAIWMLQLGIPAAEVAQALSDARRRTAQASSDPSSRTEKT